jgi:hypothetical protein
MDKLLTRLDDIGQSLAQSGHGLALIGLGSVGTELARLDAYSDLDFFAIVETGYKAQYLEDLSWLSRLCPIGYSFRNTVDGYKLLYTDGIFCEFAVFEPAELSHIPFAAGRLVWKQPQVADTIALPQFQKGQPDAAQSLEWLLGEALTNLYVGLGRYRRGEKLSAFRLVQHYAVDRVMELSARREMAQAGYADSFSPERRYEQRFPQIAQAMPQFMSGYDATPASARAILTFLAQHFDINPTIKQTILDLCDRS